MFGAIIDDIVGSRYECNNKNKGISNSVIVRGFFKKITNRIAFSLFVLNISQSKNELKK